MDMIPCNIISLNKIFSLVFCLRFPATGKNIKFAMPTPYNVDTNAVAIPAPRLSIVDKSFTTLIKPRTAPTSPNVGAYPPRASKTLELINSSSSS